MWVRQGMTLYDDPRLQGDLFELQKGPFLASRGAVNRSEGLCLALRGSYLFQRLRYPSRNQIP